MWSTLYPSCHLVLSQEREADCVRPASRLVLLHQVTPWSCHLRQPRGLLMWNNHGYLDPSFKRGLKSHTKKEVGWPTKTRVSYTPYRCYLFIYLFFCFVYWETEPERLNNLARGALVSRNDSWPPLNYISSRNSNLVHLTSPWSSVSQEL